MTIRKTDDERLQALEEKMAQIKAKKQQLASRIQSKERKERTRRLIQVGAIFVKHFEIQDPEHAEKIAIILRNYVANNKDKILNMTTEELEKANKKIGIQKQEESTAN